jgi:hypothetical protein
MQSSYVNENGPLSPWFLADTGDDDDAAQTSASRKEQPVKSDAPTILVVDDDPANLALAEAILQAEGFQVCVAADAESHFRGDPDLFVSPRAR